MHADEICHQSIAGIAEHFLRRDFSAVELTRALLGRIEALEPRLHAFALLTPEAALAAAADADAALARGASAGPLHGIPVGVKDLCDTAGIVTAAGMAIRAGHVPATDATVVARLKAAGAVILGKLKTTEGAFSLHHPAVVPPLNPWDASLWTGVSSSGSGVAVAAGLCFAAIGSDTLGSIRFPSAMNGVSGLKPTWGRVSRAGVFPLAQSMDHIGPIARSAADAALMLGAIAGADAADPTTLCGPVPDYTAGIAAGVRGLRVGIDRGWIESGTDAASWGVVQAACGLLAGLGARLVDVVLPDTDRVVEDAITQCAVETALAHAETFPARAAEYGPALAGLIGIGRGIDGMTLAAAGIRRAEFRGRIEALFETIDVLLMPAMHLAAPTLAQLDAGAEGMPRVLRFTTPFNLSGNPSLTLPGGQTAEGFPIGFQIVGRHGEEATVLRAGHAFQQACGWHLRHPPC